MSTEVEIVYEVINLEISSKITEKTSMKSKRSKSELMAIVRSSNNIFFENKIKETNKNLELNKYINNLNISQTIKHRINNCIQLDEILPDRTKTLTLRQQLAVKQQTILHLQKEIDYKEHKLNNKTHHRNRREQSRRN